MNEIEIANLVYRCATLMTEGRLPEVVALFRHAQVGLDASGPMLDHETLLASLQVQAEKYPEGTQHLISNPIIEVDRKGNTATCQSCYTLVGTHHHTTAHILGTGRYNDEFTRLEGRWVFSRRQCLPTTSTDSVNSRGSSAVLRHNDKATSPQRLKIIAAAQQVFSTAGYSEAGIRKIADIVGVSPTILFRHFGTKAALFEAALVAALGEPKEPEERTSFGRHVAEMLGDPTQINCPHAMTVLSIGNEEAREISTRVMQEYAITPMARWLGPPDAQSRAREIVTLCAGFVLYYSRLNLANSSAADNHMVDWLAQSIQTVVDQS